MYFSPMKIKAIITGTTGMVGMGVLLECLDHPDVEKVLVINRTSINMIHPKLTEIIHADFYSLSSISDKLSGYNACFFCLGVSSAGMNEETYSKLTYDLTINFANEVIKHNSGMTFNYVTGAGCDSTEKGRIMWARVKGRTENSILAMPFKSAYMFRAGAIIPEKGVKSSTALYNAIYVILRPFFPLMKRMKSITTSVKLGKAMINSVLNGCDKTHLENQDINTLAS
jgi:hypothetical protein